MADPKLIVTKSDGTLLFDSRKITYGLVRSGSMQYLETWSRRLYRGGNQDPAYGTSWSASGLTGSGANFSDDMYGFTIPNARSPIAFITGSGSLNTIRKSAGGSATFIYSGASVNSRFFCFDLMSDTLPGKPYLKTFLPSGVLTFNSLQPPLRVIRSIQAPPAGGGLPYAGGGIEFFGRSSGGAPFGFTTRFSYTMQLTPGVSYAAHCPWSRGCTIQPNANNTFIYRQQIGLIEGCAGSVGLIYFQYNPAGGTPNPLDVPPVGVNTFRGIVADPRPVALLIDTANYPFPFN